MGKKSIFRVATTALLLLSGLLYMYSAEVAFTYDQLGDKRSGYGFGTTGLYDMCIRVDNPEFAGSKISGIRLRIPNEKGGSVDKTGKIWLSKELPQYPLDESQLIACKEIDIEKDGEIIAPSDVSGEATEVFVKFDEGVEMPADGLYAGYSLNVFSLPSSPRRYPVETVPGEVAGGLYMRSENRTSWVDVTFTMMKMSTMEVVINHKVAENAAGIEVVGIPKTKIGEGGVAVAKIYNYGLNVISNITYETAIADKSVEKTYCFETPIDARYGTYAEVRLPVPSADELGMEKARLMITRVNGLPNEASNPGYETDLMTWPEVPVKRPMVEEFTGLWCGACPAGYVAIEQGRDEIGSDFVAVAYHLNDLIETDISYPIRPASLPDARIDRKFPISPGNIVQEWKNRSLRDTDAAITVDAYWRSASKMELYADVEAIFMTEHKNSNLALCYVVVADGLSSDSWVQTNYFSGAVQGGKYWDLFTKGGAYVYDLEFNNIPVAAETAFGVSGSLPHNIEQYRKYGKQFKIDISAAKTIIGEGIVQNPDKLRVIAYILDTDSGEILNSVSSAYPVIKESGVENISAESAIGQTDTRYFNLQGIDLKEAPHNTPYIEQTPSGSRLRLIK